MLSCCFKNKLKKSKIMRYIIFCFILLSACTSSSKLQNDAPITLQETQIAKNLIQGAFDDLWGGVDSTKILQYHTPDFIILEQGEIWDNDRIKKFMRGQIAKPDRPKRINRMEYISIEKYGPSMQIAYYNYADFVKADSIMGKASWLESALAVPTKDGWRLKMMHSTWAGNK